MARLSIIGVGPGDPELITVAGLRALQTARVVAYPVARPGAESMARTIAAPWMQAGQLELPLHLPMTAAVEPRQQGWAAAARALAEQVGEGADTALLCEGDVSLYASASYLLLSLRQQQQQTELALRLIPGVTSLAAAAAAAHWPLALQQQAMLVAPTPEAPEALLDLLSRAEVLVLLKLHHRWTWVRPLLERQGLLDKTLVAQRLGWPDQTIVPARALRAVSCSYFSLLLIRCCWPTVMPHPLGAEAAPASL